MSCNCCEPYCYDCYPRIATTTSTTTTTTLCPDAIECDAVYLCKCIEYTGGDWNCFNIHNGDGLCDVIEVIFDINNIPNTTTTTSTTTTSTTTTTTTSTTTTTTRAISEFIMNAVTLTSVDTWLISSTCPFSIVWGDGNTTNYSPGNFINVSHTYSTSYTGQIILQSYNLNAITYFNCTNGTTPNTNISIPYYPLTITTSELSKLTGLVTLLASGGDIYITGVTGDLPRSLEILELGRTNLSGTTSNLPQATGGYNGLTRLFLTGANTLSGTTAGLPRKLNYIAVLGQNNITGSTSDLPRGTTLAPLTYLQIEGLNQISGPTGDALDSVNVGVPRTVTFLRIFGSNTISGDIKYLPHALTELSLLGNTQVTGDITYLSNVLQLIQISGTNTIYGPIGNLSLSLTYLYVTGNNNITGTTDQLNNVIEQIYLAGNSVITGDISAYNLPSSLTSIYLVGSGTSALITGDLADLPINLEYFQLGNGSSLYGTIDDLPTVCPSLKTFTIGLGLSASITGDIASLATLPIGQFNIACANTIYGDISLLPNTLGIFSVQGSNTISGDLQYLASSIKIFNVQSVGQTITYIIGSPHTWPTGMNTVIVTGGAGTLNDVNDLLVDLSNTTWVNIGSSSKKVTVRGPINGAGTAAKLILQGLGVTVTIV